MDEREELARAAGLEEAAALMDRWVSECDCSDYDDNIRADHYAHAAEQIRALGACSAAGSRRIPEPGSAEENAAVERAVAAYNGECNQTNLAYKRPMRAALRAALATDVPMEKKP